MMKNAIRLAVILIILSLFCTGCGAKAAAVSFNELVSSPDKYSGKTVSVEGIYVRGWEWILLADAVAYAGTGANRELRPVGDSIWFASLMPKEVQDKLYVYKSPAGDTTYYGKIKATGLFETEGEYGHMNLYKYRFTATKVELLDWTPPE